MKREYQFRVAAFLLGLTTLSAIAFAVINLKKEKEVSVPDDGIWWVEQHPDSTTDNVLVAQRVDEGGPGDLAGIKTGDRLVAISNSHIRNSADRMHQLYRQGGAYSKPVYTVVRDGVQLDVPLIPIPADKSLNDGLRLIALTYLLIGLYVLLRRWTAPKSTHFYIFCLVSFIFYSFKYTGKLNTFDEIIYWSNVVAWLLQPALFLHFALTFPSHREFIRRHPWLLAVVYLPGTLLLGLQVTALRALAASEVLRWNLDRVQMAYLAAYFIAAAVILWDSYRRTRIPIVRQQMKWVTRGTILAVAPFLFYVFQFMRGATPGTATKICVLALVFLPLTFGYAIVRYRLMDVDVIFNRSMVYTLATGPLAVRYFFAISILAAVLRGR